MPDYLMEFNKKLKPFQGSLVRVNYVKDIEPNAKEYLNKLSKEGSIENFSYSTHHKIQKT